MSIQPHMVDLARAFEEARLVAVHIDMQATFYEHVCKEKRIPTYEVFPKVKQFSDGLRRLGIPNHWVAYTGHWAKTQYKDFKVGKHGKGKFSLSRDLSLLKMMDIQDDDLVFEKAKQWALRNGNCHLTNHFRAKGTDTLIIDGVKDKHCIAQSIVTGLKNNFRIYAAMDATNCPEDQFADYAEWFLQPSDLTAEQKSRVTFTTTQKILDTIKMSQLMTSQPQHRAHG